MNSRHRLTRALVLLVLFAALGTAPVFLFAEEFDSQHVLRVLASNGVCVAFSLGLLALLRRGHVELTARVLVFGLLVLVGALAWTNGEDVHVNVVNFVLVTVLAATLLGRAQLLGIGAIIAAAMTTIAWRQAVPGVGEELFETRVESIVQFLPTYTVIVLVLWMQNRAQAAKAQPPILEST